MKVAVVFYSRTGNTELVVSIFKQVLMESGFTVNVFKVIPIEEYARPLHVNPRLIHETLVRKGTNIEFKPFEPRLEEYEILIVASPIWYNTLTPPIQEFLKRYRPMKPLIIVTTSTLVIDPEKIKKVVEELCGSRPIVAINLVVAVLKDETRILNIVHDLVKVLKSLTLNGN